MGRRQISPQQAGAYLAPAGFGMLGGLLGGALGGPVGGVIGTGLGGAAGGALGSHLMGTNDHLDRALWGAGTGMLSSLGGIYGGPLGSLGGSLLGSALDYSVHDPNWGLYNQSQTGIFAPDYYNPSYGGSNFVSG